MKFLFVEEVGAPYFIRHTSPLKNLTIYNLLSLVGAYAQMISKILNPGNNNGSFGCLFFAVTTKNVYICKYRHNDL